MREYIRSCMKDRILCIKRQDMIVVKLRNWVEVKIGIKAICVLLTEYFREGYNQMEECLKMRED